MSLEHEGVCLYGGWESRCLFFVLIQKTVTDLEKAGKRNCAQTLSSEKMDPTLAWLNIRVTAYLN